MAVRSAPAYCDVILRRIMNLTGETPTLAETGETFAAAAEFARRARRPGFEPEAAGLAGHQTSRPESVLRT